MVAVSIFLAGISIWYKRSLAVPASSDNFLDIASVVYTATDLFAVIHLDVCIPAAFFVYSRHLSVSTGMHGDLFCSSLAAVRIACHQHGRGSGIYWRICADGREHDSVIISPESVVGRFYVGLLDHIWRNFVPSRCISRHEISVRQTKTSKIKGRQRYVSLPACTIYIII